MTKFVFMDKFRWTQNLIIFENLSFPEKIIFLSKVKSHKMFNEMESRCTGNTLETKRLDIYLCNALNVKNDIISRF